MNKNTSKYVFFISTFVLANFVILPYTLYFTYTVIQRSAFYNYFTAVPLFVLVQLVSKLANSKFDNTFFKSPIDALWNREISILKKISDNKMEFDPKVVTKEEFYLFLTVITIATVTYSVLFLTNANPRLFDMLIVFGLFVAFGTVLNIAPFRFYRKKQMEGDPKPYWYCFSYVINRGRFERKTFDLTAHVSERSLKETLIASLIAIFFFVDWVGGAPLLSAIFWGGSDPVVANIKGLIFAEFVIAGLLLVEALKYFYLKEQIEDIKKMPTP